MKNDFYQRVYALVMEIPRGRICTYGAIARFLGAARSARLVGYALKAALPQMALPAHRVVNRQGMLTGKHQFGHHEAMEAMLRDEGIEVVDDQVRDFERYFWDPADHLHPDKF